jgi:hypothetical protein
METGQALRRTIAGVKSPYHHEPAREAKMFCKAIPGADYLVRTPALRQPLLRSYENDANRRAGFHRLAGRCQAATLRIDVEQNHARITLFESWLAANR